MTRRILATLFVFTALAYLPQPPAASAEDVRLHGAASVADRLINPYKSAVEKATGYNLIVVVSNAGKGLIDLVQGTCDAALSSASLETTVQAAKAAGKEIDIANLQMTVVATDEVVFIVHPSNPVNSLTWEQIRDIQTGKITNWKEVGGKDAPIAVITDAPASATRGLIKQVVMQGQDYSPKATAVDEVKKVNDMVAVTENGIGGLGKGFVVQGQVKIIETKKVERPLGFVTVGPPSGKVKSVIEAYKVQVKK